MREYVVYMLRCNDGHYYVGVTSDVDRRVSEHQSGTIPKCYTHSRRPVRLVYTAQLREVLDAIAWEKKVKGWSRKKKEALIAGECERLPVLSERRTKKEFRS